MAEEDKSTRAIVVDKQTFAWSSAVVGMLIGCAFWFGNEYAKWMTIKELDIPHQLALLRSDADKIKNDLTLIKSFIGLRAESTTTEPATTLNGAGPFRTKISDRDHRSPQRGPLNPIWS